MGYERLKGIPLLFLTGKFVSPETVFAIRRCVHEEKARAEWAALPGMQPVLEASDERGERRRSDSRPGY